MSTTRVRARATSSSLLTLSFFPVFTSYRHYVTFLFYPPIMCAHFSPLCHPCDIPISCTVENGGILYRPLRHSVHSVSVYSVHSARRASTISCTKIAFENAWRQPSPFSRVCVCVCVVNLNFIHVSCVFALRWGPVGSHFWGRSVLPIIFDYTWCYSYCAK